MRYMLPLVPLLCLAAGALVADWGRARRALAVAVALLLAGPAAWNSARHSALLAQTDTRVLAARWIEEHIPAGSRIGLCCGSDYGYPHLRLDRPTLAERSAEMRSAGLAARRQERLLALGEALPGPGYELIQMRTTNPQGFSWIWTTHGVERLKREGVDWVVIHELPGLAYSPLDSSLVAALATEAERRVLIDPIIDAEVARRYDPIDAFYAPVSGIAGVGRPGPRIAIYRLGGPRLSFDGPVYNISGGNPDFTSVADK